MGKLLFLVAGFVFFGMIVGALAVAPSYAFVRDQYASAQDAKEHEAGETGESVVQERRTADYTLTLDRWTAGLVAVAFAQMIMFGVQLAYMRGGLKDSRDAAKAARKSAKIAGRSLTRLERPWLFIDLEPGLLPCAKPTEFCDKEAVFNLVNYGRFPAVIDEFACTLNIGVGPGRPIVRDDFHRVLAPNAIIPDGRVYLPPTDLNVDIIWNSEGTEVISQVPHAPSGEGLFAVFSVIYRGVGNREHESLFCWRWNYTFNRWDRGPPENNRQT